MANITKEPCERWMIVYYRICRSHVSHFCFFLPLSPFSFINHGFDLIMMDFDFSLPLGDKFIQLNDRGTVNWLLGLDRILKLLFYHLYLGDVGVLVVNS